MDGSGAAWRVGREDVRRDWKAALVGSAGQTGAGSRFGVAGGSSH